MSTQTEPKLVTQIDFARAGQITPQMKEVAEREHRNPEYIRERVADGRILFHDGGADEPLAEDTPVSMNLFGFTPDYFDYSAAYFKEWFAANRENLKAEFYIPTMVNKLIGEGTASLRVLRSTAQWHGVTYKEDKPALMASIERMIAEGKYPRNLWK